MIEIDLSWALQCKNLKIHEVRRRNIAGIWRQSPHRQATGVWRLFPELSDFYNIFYKKPYF